MTLGFNNAMASLADWLFSGNLLRFPKLKLAYSEGQIGWIPYVLERADTVWEMHDAWMHAKERIPVPPSTQYYGRIFGCFTADRHGLRSLEEVGEDNICFETDYPHTDTTWPYSEAYIEKLCVGLDRRAGLQGPARQRHQDAGARPGLTAGNPGAARRAARPLFPRRRGGAAVSRPQASAPAVGARFQARARHATPRAGLL